MKTRHKQPTPTSPLADFASVAQNESNEDKVIAERMSAERRMRYNHPAYSRIVARAILKHAFDYSAVVSELAPWVKSARIREELADRIEQSEVVRAALEKELESRDLGDGSKRAFVEKMWDWLTNGTEKERITAARVLGRGFIGEKVTTDKPEELPIAGFDDGIRNMGLDKFDGAPDEAAQSGQAAQAAEAAQAVEVE